LKVEERKLEYTWKRRANKSPSSLKIPKGFQKAEDPERGVAGEGEKPWREGHCRNRERQIS